MVTDEMRWCLLERRRDCSGQGKSEKREKMGE
jgi:hypothetical protein